ncbi:hypothetical protein KIPB_004365 [Kipferlia bialata]|uniref:Saposin B-type domain-containing protein n=1 Tax=Kipferlia bialata TaxID=797122 RepID=A0A9K3CVC5_9EUKA|nr:hypothetical protein KIPB_004365 [Kipferlia bialata]|eukprot:g4365.t1
MRVSLLVLCVACLLVNVHARKLISCRECEIMAHSVERKLARGEYTPEQMEEVLDEGCETLYSDEPQVLEACMTTYDTLIELSGQGYPADVTCEMMGNCEN